jgi:hypothetical protein
LQGAGWQYRATFGTARKGTFGPPPGEYNFGAAVNITNPYLGFNAQLNRLANDFGVQQWWQFTGQLIINELFRIQSALVTGAVDRTIYTAEVTDRLNALGFRPVPAGGKRHLLAEDLGVIAQSGAAPTDLGVVAQSGAAPTDLGVIAQSGAAPAGGSSIVAGVEALRSAGSTLMQRVAERMGLTVADLIDGLRAGGVPVPGGPVPLTRMSPLRTQQQQQQQPAPAQPAANLAAATASNQKLASLVTFANGPDAVAADAVVAPAAPKMAAEITPDVPASSKVISQVTNESEGDAGMLAQLNQNLAADRAAVGKTAAQDQVKQREPVVPVTAAAGRK